MLDILKLQLKNSLRDKIIVLSICLPVVVALVLKFYVPSVIVLEPQLAVVEGNLAGEQLEQLRELAQIEQYPTVADLKARVLNNTDEVIGVVYDNESSKYNFFLEGNETTLTHKLTAVMASVLSGNASSDPAESEILTANHDQMISLIIAITMMMALYLGSTFIIFTMVSEKEEGIAVLNQIMPISPTQYAVQKIILGFLGTVVITFVIGFMLFSSGKLVYLLPFLTIAAGYVSIIGLVVGSLAPDLVVAIITTKVVLLVLIFVPIIAFIMPPNLEHIKAFFNLIPSYPIFDGIIAISNGSNLTRILPNILIMVAHIAAGYGFYFAVLRPGGRFYSSK